MAKLGTVEKFIEILNKEVGTIEGPRDNETKYGKWSGANFQPWCGSFVNWCADKSGVKVPKTVYTPSGAAAFKQSKRWHKTPKIGDIVYFDFPGDGVTGISHVGVVVKDNEDGTVWTIEGNTSGDPHRSQRNGGEVAKKLRAYKKNKAGIIVSIVGFGRPKFVE